MTRPTVLPCPCCGGKARLCQWRDTVNPNATWVECVSEACGVMTDSQHAETPEEAARLAIAIWSRRTETAKEGK